MKTPNIMPSMREWWEDNRPHPAAQPTKAENQPLIRTPATDEDRLAIAAISPSLITYVPATGPKRFARDIQGAMELTAHQRDYVWKLVWRMRRQIGDKRLVDLAQDRIAQAMADKGEK